MRHGWLRRRECENDPTENLKSEEKSGGRQSLLARDRTHARVRVDVSRDMKRLRVFDRSSFDAPSPTSAKFKRRVARYFPDGDGTGATAADEKSDEKGAEKARETPAIEAVDEPDDPPVSEEVVEEEPEEKPGVEPAKTGDEVEPVPYSSLAALDEGMARTMKSNRKRSRDAQTLLKRAVKTKEIKFFNRIIKDFGNDKQMGFAEEAFRRIGDAGLSPTVYSYTNLLNACVRVGELDRARKVWDDMIAAGVEPNEVTYTVLVKGLAQDGLLAEAARTVRDMTAQSRAGVECVAPNVRTFSTLLRNCVRHADPKVADECFAAMRDANVTPDVASFEYLLKARCAAMDANGAWAVVDDFDREYLEIPPQAHAALATVSSLTGDIEKARSACEAARQAVKDNGAGTVEDDGAGELFGSGGYGSDSDEPKAGNDNEQGKGNKKDKRQQQQQQQEEASKSVQQFLKLRNSDALRQVDEVEKFLALGDDFVKEVAEVVNRGPESESSPVLIVEGIEDAKKPLNFKEVFGNDLPVRLEVCSGHGDWVTERAQRDEGKANWLALEMRRNRIRMTWAKAVRRRLDNVALLCGMAHEMMGAHVASGSLTEVYVNYPDPPEWVGSLQCLVDQAFLRDAHRSLKPGVGHLTLVTDDPNYAMRMCRELSKVPGLFKSTEPGGKAFKSGVPEGYGGSYFDEMWKNGRQNDRYYIRYKRV